MPALTNNVPFWQGNINKIIINNTDRFCLIQLTNQYSQDPRFLKE